MRVAIYQKGGQWRVLFPNGSTLKGFASADDARRVAERNGHSAIYLTEEACSKIAGVQWHYIKVGNLEHWRAELGKKVIAEASRENVEDYWECKIFGESYGYTASITELAQLLSKKLNNEN